MSRISLRYLFTGSLVLLLGVTAVPRAWAQDPGVSGPFAVTVEEYNYGDTAFTPPGFPGPVELVGQVHRPTNLSGGPFPLLVFLHGRHGVCESGVFTWPCPSG